MGVLVKMVTASGEEHGLINEFPNNVPFDDFKNFKPEHKEEMKRLKKENSKIVKAEYINARGRHDRLEKAYCAGSGEPIQIWKLIPGRTYELPLGLINEVNDPSKRMKKRSGLVSVDGEAVRKDEAPLEKDMEGEYLHRLVPVGF